MHGIQGSADVPVLGVELRPFGSPVAILVSCDLSGGSPRASFIGLGTSLETLDELIGLNLLSREPNN
jgi:hypothetical protein